ncbi:hypothetical protein SAMN02745126_04002 [Enhydrobacter aerosaccus]|uniref:Capsid Gp10A/Gp10B-like domain-containing protein n=1 Tax=Enhydrobacter aerosaccus TaxID=225324 RepID=A0A1T4RP70_9HYPH|nr:hypothetical protein [Enhydrobacter aerosaccus]SKA17733.1 hypothetical protein SAMN02745126_04002 [Enhydrobacter aerosaccus]
MSESNIYTPSNPGLRNGGSDPYELYRTVFPGEVLEAYDQLRILSPLVFTRTITMGKGAEFPAIGRASSRYFSPGERLTGQGQIAMGQQLINVDYPLISDLFILDFEDAMIHYELRSRYAHQLGEALANGDDKDTAIVLYKAARLSTDLTGTLPGGTQIAVSNMNTDGGVLADAIFDAGIDMDVKSVPASDRHAALPPVQYALVVKNGKAIDRQYNKPDMSNGTYASGVVKEVNGTPIHKSLHLPNGTNITTNPTGARNDYTGDFTKSVGIVFHGEAAGCVRRWELETQMETRVDSQGTLLVGRMMHGKAPLRGACAVELATP